ncbi:MAG TPA: protein kinase, partial [Thermoanaerobaculia bacterium]|nr:protein kinase [Thermoanaerobaculia bacterium]
MIGARLANRFLIASEIGRGGMGVVYLAHDPMLDREVAVKLVPPNLLRPEAAERLKREARVIAKLDHPGIVVVHDIGEHEGSLFFVMPLLQGRNLRDFIRSEKVTVQELLEIISQAAEALEYSHAHGVVHRDVKPENIMVTRDHNEGLRVRMTDFGLAIGSTDQRITASGSLIGTAAYLSPEQVSNQEVDARSDIYSLATILYECLVGEPPFGVDLVGVLYRVLHENPQSPRSVGVEIPPELDDLILRALEKSPDKRPQSAGQMAEELRRCSAGLVESLLSAEVSTTTSPTVRYDRAQHLAPFVGREKEFADLQRKLNAALSGECQFVVIGGDVGIGKSRLAEEIERLSRARKIQVLHGRFFDHDRGFPYQGFCEVLQEYFRRRKEGARADFSDLAGDLESIFPVLAEIDEIRFAAGDGERPQPPVEMRKMDDRTYIFELIARSITRISAGHPLVLILEDLHAADVSVDALQYVVRRLGPTPTLILATYDSSDVDRSHPLNRMLANFKGDRRFQQFVLQPLGPAEHRSFLQQTIGSTNLDDAFVQRIYEATEGNPYFTRELVRSLVDSGGVVRSVSGSFALSGDSGIFTDALPVTIQQAVENRIERLPEELREILFAASVLGRRFKIRDLEAVLEGGDELEDSIDKLIDSGFVQEDRESSRDLVSFSSGIVRDVLYSALPRRKRKALHRRYAMFLETRHADRLDQVLAPLLHHYTQADVTEKIIEYGLRLARKSVEAFSPEDAIYAAKIVIDVLEDDPAVEVEAQILLADGYRMAGNTEAALKEFERAGKTAEHSGDGQALIQTILKAAETSWEGRNIDETRRWSERGVEVSRSVGDDNSLSRLLSLGATVANLRGEYGKAKEYLDEVERLRPASRDRKSELPRGGRLIVGMSHPVQIKHPAEITLAEEGEVLASVFEPLVSTDAQGTVVPCLCERWEILDAGRSFLFEVRRGITMHDGRPFTSTEVQLAIQEAIRHRKSTPLAAYAVLQGVEEFLSGQTESISGIVIVSDYKLLFHLTEPLPLFPALLTDVRTGLARVASDGLRSRLIGTGPFMVSQQHPDRVVLQRNPNYWRLGAPALDAIEFRAGMSAAELASGFVSGELDLARDLLPDDLDQIIRNR